MIHDFSREIYITSFHWTLLIHVFLLCLPLQHKITLNHSFARKCCSFKIQTIFTRLITEVATDVGLICVQNTLSARKLPFIWRCSVGVSRSYRQFLLWSAAHTHTINAVRVWKCISHSVECFSCVFLTPQKLFIIRYIRFQSIAIFFFFSSFDWWDDGQYRSFYPQIIVVRRAASSIAWMFPFFTFPIRDSIRIE